MSELFLHMTEIAKLRQLLIEERAAYLKLYDEAYPDVGMPMADWVARQDAVKQLVAEGKLPEGYIDPK